MNSAYINKVLNDILCNIKELQRATIAKLRILWNSNVIEEDAISMNFTGNVEVSSDTNGNTTVNIPVYTNEDGDIDLAFDADRPITRNVLGMLGDNLGVQGVINTLEELLYPYLAPSITLSVTQSIFEKDSGTDNIIATITTTKGSSNIISVTLERNSTEIYDETSVNSNGQVINVNETINSTDGTDLTPYLVPYQAFVNDGTTTVNSLIRNVTFVYPFYSGVGAAAANEATIKLMGTQVVTSGNKVRTYNPSNQKLYFAYPTAYGALTSITDGALNITGAFTTRTENWTQQDGETVSYRIYESNNLLTVTGYTVYYNF